MMWLRRVRVLMVLSGLLLWPRAEFGYSVQTHEQLIDLAWKPWIVPLLEKRYPGLTQAEMNEAHAYAYGGCAIQDVGYYPFGSEFFSNLTHYVRSGDFVRRLLRDARTANELAFAIGAMSHYEGDSIGHAMATNPSVAAEFPKLGAKYGGAVTYDENPHAHVRVEFSFDINEIAKHRFAPSAYLSAVGLNVATDLLARAFFDTYGLRLEEVLGQKRERTTIGGYRFAVRHFLPRIAYAETVLHRKQMPADVQDADLEAMEKALGKSDFENGWELYRKKAGLGTYVLAGVLYVLPPIGPLALARIKGPTDSAEQAYVKSVNASGAAIGKLVRGVGPSGFSGELPNLDLDTGLPTREGTYRLTDETYAKLLGRVTAQGYGRMPSGLREDMLAFYANPDAADAVRKNAKKWAAVRRQLMVLQTISTVPED